MCRWHHHSHCWNRNVFTVFTVHGEGAQASHTPLLDAQPIRYLPFLSDRSTPRTHLAISVQNGSLYCVGAAIKHGRFICCRHLVSSYSEKLKQKWAPVSQWHKQTSVDSVDFCSLCLLSVKLSTLFPFKVLNRDGPKVFHFLETRKFVALVPPDMQPMWLFFCGSLDYCRK